MRCQKKQKKNPKAVRVRIYVPSSTLHIQCDCCESCVFPCGIYPLKPTPDCGLDPTMPTAGRLEELGVCSGFTHQLLVPADKALSTEGCAFPREMTMFWRAVVKLLWGQHGHHRRDRMVVKGRRVWG